jgi:hypothetical protein
MLTCNKYLLGIIAALAMLGPVPVSADDAPPYASATDAYRQGDKALKSNMPATAVPALEYAAKRGVLGAQVKLARAYASGRDLPKDDAKAFIYFQQIADQQADINPRSPIAKYAAEAFVALGQYYLDGIPDMPLASNPSYAGQLFRHAASYFGNAEAQYRLARLYMNGAGVEKNVGLAVIWLATAAKKQHPASQATLGEILWRGEEVRQRRARGLALIMLAHQNASANGKEPPWISDLYGEAFGKSDNATRKDAQALLPELGGSKLAVTAPSAKAKPAEILVMPASGESAEPPAAAGAGAPPPASLGLSVGFGASGTEATGLKP